MSDDRSNAKSVSVEGRKATYRSVSANSPTASKLFFQMQGAAGKIIKITDIAINGVLTTSAPGIIGLYRATGAVANPAGTSAVTPLSMDSNDSAAAALVNGYTAADFVGSDTAIAIRNTLFGSTTIQAPLLSFVFGKNGGKALTLRGAAEFFKIYVQFASYAGMSVNVEVEHTEEAA